MPVPPFPHTAPRAPVPGAGERVMVIAPHPDDESLGSGGWIYSACRRGARVRILFLTHGEAFRLAAVTFGGRYPDHSACRRLGAQRRLEAEAAAEALGVPRSELRFLGYPDRGLNAMLQLPPNRVYHSRQSGRAATDESAQIPDRPYCGHALDEDLRAEIRAFNPGWILYPHPQDDHSDHRACSRFAAKAVHRLEPEDRPKRIGSYLIHCGLWPLPHRLAPDARLLPPRRLIRKATGWTIHSLDHSAFTAKARALRAHASQHPWAFALFGAHLRKDELLFSDLADLEDQGDRKRDG